MSEEVEKRAGALTHEISSNSPTQFDISAKRHCELTQKKGMLKDFSSTN
jgi:hypothetical protein